MLIVNHSDRKDIDRIILKNHSLVIITQAGEAEVYYLSKVQSCDDSASKKYRHIVKKMKDGEAK